ncbi:MAG TPA: PHP domain-containing protein [Patescibacteria group bacterium]|nr:PHP domain-containing protein [Patescibacteria group bacterium]
MPRRRHDVASDPVVPPRPTTIDLHTHTVRSDGVLEPAALVAAAAAVGVRLLAITDHDDLSAFRELTDDPGGRAIPAGMTLLPGVEINCLTGDVPELWESELHILGLGVDPADDALEATLVRQRDRRRVRFARTLVRLRELGLPVDDVAAELDPTQTASLGRPTVARLLQAKGYVTSVEDGFARYLGRGRPAYVPRDGIGPVDAIHAIRGAGGLAVLAHFSEAPDRVPIVRELAETGLGGLEVYYRTFDQATVAAVGSVADELRLLKTGGSDYHGDTGPYAEAHAQLWVPPEAGEALTTWLASSASAPQTGSMSAR